jgi:hypothetical protein
MPFPPAESSVDLSLKVQCFSWAGGVPTLLEKGWYHHKPGPFHPHKAPLYPSRGVADPEILDFRVTPPLRDCLSSTLENLKIPCLAAINHCCDEKERPVRLHGPGGKGNKGR